MSPQDRPTYPLLDVQFCARQPYRCIIEPEAQRTAWKLNLDPEAIKQHLDDLKKEEFFHAVPAKNPKWRGAMMDVYKPMFGKKRLYIKFHMSNQGNEMQLIVTSFKEDESR